MNDVRRKITMLRQFYSAKRYASTPLDYARLQKLVVHGRDQQFIPLIGFNDHPSWSRRLGKDGRFTEMELKRIAKFFHLDEITHESEEGWQLLTDRLPHEYFAVRLVEKGYGTLRSVPNSLAVPAANPSRADFLNSLLSFPARALDIQVVEIAEERGAAERHDLEEQNLLRLFRAWTKYEYQITGDSNTSGNLYVLEVSSTIGGDRAACVMIAPSVLHPNKFYTSPTVVPETLGKEERTSFKMSDKDARCTTIAFVTTQPLLDLPVPRPNSYFATLPIESVYLLAEQLATLKPSASRGICTLGLRT
jgi:hypothetical protein